MIGQTLSHYQIVEQLGEGGMGVVYRALDTRLHRPVAIKVFPPDAVVDEEHRRRFLQEARSASALNHPNIITVYDVGAARPEPAGDRADTVNFIAMEYVAGQTLDRLIGRHGLRLGDALKYAVQIADALAAAHAAGIVHRDLKPSNVMVTEKGLVTVMDFGLAKLADMAASPDLMTRTVDAGPRTEAGTILGTVGYMSPEQAEGKKVDAQSDIFSFGALLYEMVTGRRPFTGETKVSTLAAILHKEPQSPSEIAEGLPRELDRIYLARTFMDSGELVKARQALDRGRPEDRQNYRTRRTRAMLLALEGRRAEALKEMDEEVLKWEALVAYETSEAAEFFALVGDTQKALDWLDLAVRSGDERAEWFRRDPLLASVRNHPRFEQIQESIAYRTPATHARLTWPCSRLFSS